MRCCSFCSVATAAKYSFRQRPSQNGATSAPPRSMAARGRVLQLTRQRFPIRSRPEPLQNVNLVRVYAEEDSLLPAFNSAQNSGRGRFRRGSREPIETRNIFFALGCRRRGAQPRMPRDRRPCRASASSANVLTLSSSPTFTKCVVTAALVFPSDCAVRRSPASSTSASASAEPAPASCCASARPMPDPAPVTAATAPLKNGIRKPQRWDRSLALPEIPAERCRLLPASSAASFPSTKAAAGAACPCECRAAPHVDPQDASSAVAPPTLSSPARAKAPSGPAPASFERPGPLPA